MHHKATGLELLSLLGSSRTSVEDSQGHRISQKFLLHAAELVEVGPDRPAESAGWISGIANSRICNFLAESMRYSSTSPLWNRFYSLRLGKPVVRHAVGPG